MNRLIISIYPFPMVYRYAALADQDNGRASQQQLCQVRLLIIVFKLYIK